MHSLLFVLMLALLSQTPPAQTDWSFLKMMEGSWQGTGKGQPGTSTVERSYEFVLGGKFLSERNRSAWAPTAANPKGEVHEDSGMFSYDRARKRFVFRQFHVEGFVNEYSAEPVPASAKRMVFEHQAIENIPAGYRARETYTFVGPDELIELFELAEPGKDYALYSESHLKRKK